MSYNGSGTFNINTTGQPVVSGTIISAATFNALTADLATGLTTALTNDGQTTATARIPFAQGITSTLVTDASSVSTGSIITAGGVGIAKKLYVGTDANIAGNAAVTGNLTITGTLGVTGVATFSATPIYSSLTASSAVATDASKALVSVANTGTGSNVLATSPTLVTPLLGTPTSATLTNATGLPLSTGVTGTLPIANGGTNSTATATAGGIAYGTGTAIAVNSAGSVGQLLQSNGASAPTWVAASAGALTLLSTVTASASATVDIESTFDSTYNTYALVVSDLRTSGVESIFMRMKLSGSYVTASTYYGQLEVSSSASALYSGTTDSASPYITIIPSASAAAAAGCSFIMYITNPEVTNSRKTVNWSGVHSYNAEVIKSIGVGMNNTAGALTGLRFYPSTGTLTGTFRLYGYSKT